MHVALEHFQILSPARYTSDRDTSCSISHQKWMCYVNILKNKIYSGLKKIVWEGNKKVKIIKKDESEKRIK